jgi:GxxExxY protein
LADRGLTIEREYQVPIRNKGRTLATPLRLDIPVEKLVIVEAKAVTVYNSIFEAQALTCLRLLDVRLA